MKLTVPPQPAAPAIAPVVSLLRPTDLVDGGCIGWFKARANALVGNAGAIATWYDASGNGNSLTQGTGARQPAFYNVAGINSLPVTRWDGGRTMQKSGITGFSSSACAGMAVIRSSQNQDTKTIFALAGAGFYQYLQINNSVLSFSDSNAGRTDTRLPIPPNSAVVVGWNSTPSGIRVFVNGVVVNTPVSNATSLTTINVGSADNSAGGYNFIGDIAELAVFNRSLTTAEEYALQAGFGDVYGISIAPNGRAKNVVWCGNSLVAGNGANGGGTINFDIVPATLKAMGASGLGWKAYNFGVPGQTLTQMITADPPKIAALYQPSAAKNVLCIGELINELAAGTTPANCLTKLQTLIANAQSFGFSVVVGTATPRTDFSIESNRLALNILVRALTGVQIADIASDAGLQTVNGTNFADQVHLNNAGYALAAPYWAAAILAA